MILKKLKYIFEMELCTNIELVEIWKRRTGKRMWLSVCVNFTSFIGSKWTHFLPIVFYTYIFNNTLILNIQLNTLLIAIIKLWEVREKLGKVKD